ncbi:transposon Ty3-I Gag-Pol polyprotein [Trichonephila clavipes]|nr:transposon Ty3-I Gag-Pol polyprotein [Trichonephila clavipes]
MLELFQQHLPTRVQSILAAISPLTLEKAAEVADRVMEVTQLRTDISKQALLDSETNIKCHCILGNSRIHSIKTVSGDSVYHELLRKFPDITKPPRPDQEIKHSVVHYIETNSRPVTAKARRLAPDRLRIAKAEFENMITLGHMRPSKSNYASPLHMVPKKRQHRVATSRRLPCTQCSNY